MHFELITPERVVFREEARQVTLPTAEGEITILPHHVPLVAALVSGVIQLKKESGDEEIAVSGGFIEVTGDERVRVLADTAERGKELELSVIEEAKKRAEKLMQETIHRDDASFAAAAAALERELARYRVAKKYHAPRHVPTMDAANLPPNENSV